MGGFKEDPQTWLQCMSTFFDMVSLSHTQLHWDAKIPWPEQDGTVGSLRERECVRVTDLLCVSLNEHSLTILSSNIYD